LAAVMAIPALGQRQGSQYFQTQSLPSGRQMHGASVIGDYLYVFGGNETDVGFTTSSLFAPISEDGQVGRWQSTTPLSTPGGVPITYIGNSTVTRGRIVYVCGGNVNDGGQVNLSSNIVMMAAQMNDGHLSRWLPSRPFPGPGVQICAAVATQTHLYVIGGADSANSPVPNVYIAPYVEGGLLGEWSRGPDLPKPLWFHSAGELNGTLYVWGGTTSSPSGAPGAVDDVFAADLQADGNLGAWRRVGSLPQPIYFSACATIDDTLYNFSGRFRDERYTSDVLFSIPTAAGTEWERVRATVPLNKYLAPAVDDRRGIVFFPGGRSEGSAAGIREVFGYRVPRVDQDIDESFTPSEISRGPAPRTSPSGTAPTPSPGSTVASSGTSNMLGSWNNFNDAEIQAMRSSKNMLIYFQTPQARRCREVEQTLFQSEGFAPVADSHILVRVDAAAQRHHAIQYGVYRVPTVVIASPQGQPLATFVRDFSLQDLQTAP
jgi:hypothetical protein